MDALSVKTVKSSSSRALAKKLAEPGNIPSITVRSPTTVQSATGVTTNAGDSNPAPLYRVRRVPSPKPKPTTGCCNARAKIICWAMTNLFFCLLDLIFSICEVIMYTVYTTPMSKDNYIESLEHDHLYRVFFIASVSLHGDCFESLIEIVINISGELVFTISSLLFAFASVLEKEDYQVSRCLSQWFMFSVWVPFVVLIPRFVLNVVSASECGKNSASLFPQSNENAPRIAFWIVNLLHLFLMLMWLLNGRLVALAYLNLQKDMEDDRRKQSLRKAIQGGSMDSLSVAPSVMSQASGYGGDKVLKRSGLDGLLPPTVSMV